MSNTNRSPRRIAQDNRSVGWIACWIGLSAAMPAHAAAQTAPAAPTVPAVQTPPTAQALAEQARARIQVGDRRGAIDLFDRAYAQSSSPGFLLEIARQYEALASVEGDSRDVQLALNYYQRYLEHEPSSSQRAAIEATLKTLAARPRAPAVPVEASPEQVPIHFLAYRSGDQYQVDVGDQHCATPCTLRLTQGITTMAASGAGQVKTDLFIPPRAGTVRIRHRGFNYFKAGIIMIPVGAAVGASLWATGLGCKSSGDSCVLGSFIAWPIIGGTMIIMGAVLASQGRGELPGDANRVEPVASASRKAPRIRLTQLALGPTRTGAGALVGFAF